VQADDVPFILLVAFISGDLIMQDRRYKPVMRVQDRSPTLPL
jgi:hypothetical protein